MRTIFCLYLSILTVISASAQQNQIVNNLQIGYQEFPTVITSHASDSLGYQYYSGYFRGILTINNHEPVNGNGLEDVFWVKTDSNGNVRRILTYGSANAERSYSNSMVMGTSDLLFGFSTQEAVQVGNQTIVPYATVNANAVTSALVCTDTAGAAKWVRKTNLQSFRLFYSNAVYHIFGSVSNNSPATRFQEQIVLDSIGRSGLVHLMIDTNGNFLGAKRIIGHSANQFVRLLEVSSFTDGSLFLHLFASGDNQFYLNQNEVKIPASRWDYNVIVKTDTSYQDYLYKVLNTDQQHLMSPGNQFCPSTISGNFVFMVFNNEARSTPAVPYYIDNVLQASQHNHFYVFDSSLALRYSANLGNSVVGNYPLNRTKHRIFFRHILVQKGQVFLNGMFTGTNESLPNPLPAKNVTVPILPGVLSTINLNGPSKSFLAKFNFDLSDGKVNWYGDHTEYEIADVSPDFFHLAGPNRMAFHQTVDNVWNPWLVDENLAIVTGSMRKNADLPESPQMVTYFPDGSRLVLGYARGKTALDQNGSFASNVGRSDAFLVRLRPNNQVVWYKRFHSSLARAEARHLEVRNGKAYFLVNYTLPHNDSNYIRVENTNYNVNINPNMVRTSASLLASVDTTGTITVLNLTNDRLRSVTLMNLGYFNNGDLAVGTDNANIAYQSFPSSSSPHIFRLKPSTGAIIEGRKLILQGNLSLYTIQIDKNDQLYLSGSTILPTNGNLLLHNGTSMIDTLALPANNRQQGALLKMAWNGLHWVKNFSGNVLIKQSGDLALLNDKPVMGVMTSPSTQPLLWDGQAVHNGLLNQSFCLVRLNADGTIAQKKILANTTGIYMRTGGKHLFLSSVIRSAMQVDTIQVGYAGGTTDALGLVLDSALIARKSFRVASPYGESLTDMDIFQDTLVTLAYTAQGNPQVYTNRTAIATSDYQEDAYLGTFVTRNNIVTSINNPLPAFTYVTITPNPVINYHLQLSVQTTEPLRSICTVYGTNGQYLTSAVLQLTPGSRQHSIQLPSTTGKGVYHVVISNKRWTTTRTFLIL
ncbi:hypothetical protein HRH25_17135 [Flavisolibacter sp. BT320]|nr:hypothetical protein [Flavisolibacter longurius]